MGSNPAASHLGCVTERLVAASGVVTPLRVKLVRAVGNAVHHKLPSALVIHYSMRGAAAVLGVATWVAAAAAAAGRRHELALPLLPAGGVRAVVEFVGGSPSNAGAVQAAEQPRRDSHPHAAQRRHDLRARESQVRHTPCREPLPLKELARRGSQAAGA